jgi:cell division septal protein FtsQ
MMLCSIHPSASTLKEKKVMTIQEQERKARRRKLFRLLVIYPVAWGVVSVILFYVTRIN